MSFCIPSAQAFQMKSLISAILIGIAGSAGCQKQVILPTQNTVSDNSSPPTNTSAEKVPPLYFADATQQAGIKFRHYNGAFGLKMFPEAMGSGVAWFDYDNDGWPDLFFVNGRDWNEKEINAFRYRPWSKAEIAVLEHTKGTQAKRQRQIPSHKRQAHTGALYHNNRDGTFTDVTKNSGLDVEMYGLGVAAGDYDGDGRSDLYITAYPHGFLLHNMGQGKFLDVTNAMGVADEGLNTSPVWLDYDADGRLDLFIARYADWRPERDVFYSLNGIHKSYSRPRAYKSRVCHLYRNQGAASVAQDGARFKNVSEQTGIGLQPSPIFGGKLFPLEGNALGVTVFDWNNDGNLDIAVANDMTPNHLLQGNGKGHFSEVARKAGLALTSQGVVRAGMGIDTADINHNGRDSVLIGNFAEEMLGLWENQGGALVDIAFQDSIGMASYNYLTFGLSFADFDNDSWPDFITANGHINDDVAQSNPKVTYQQRPQIFLQRQNRFFEVGNMAGTGAQKQLVGRGLACADYDLDGDIDVVISSNGGAPTLLKNDSATHFPLFSGSNHKIRLELRGRQPNTSAIGALVEAQIGDTKLRNWVRSGSSYLSQSELPITLGVGKATVIDKLTIRWTDRKTTTFSMLSVDQILLIDEAAGIVKRQDIVKRQELDKKKLVGQPLKFTSN